MSRIRNKPPKYHKSTFRNWLRYNKNAKRFVLVTVLVIFAAAGSLTLLRSFAATPETIKAKTTAGVAVSGVVFNVKVRYAPNQDFTDLGNRTTPYSLNASEQTGYETYSLTYVSAPSGYTFKAWAYPSGQESDAKKLQFTTKAYNNQTLSIILNPPYTTPVYYTPVYNTPVYNTPPPVYQTPPPVYQTPPPVYNTPPYATPPPEYATPKYNTPPYPTPSDSGRRPRLNEVYPTPAAIENDGTPPSVPQDVTAAFDESDGTVLVSWSPSTDNVGVSRYQLERSADQNTWESIADQIVDVLYVDPTANFNTKYTYRLRAFDEKGNASDYATADVTTGAFKSNITAADGGEIKNSDDTVTVSFPPGAVPEDAQCSVSDSEQIVDTEEGYLVIAGPYKIACKTANGDTITSFDEPLTVSVATPGDVRKNYSEIKQVVLNGETWEMVNAETNGDVDTFEIASGNNFAVVGKQKTTPLIVRLLLILLMIGALGAAVVAVLYVRYRRKQQSAYDDYYRKMNGY